MLCSMYKHCTVLTRCIISAYGLCTVSQISADKIKAWEAMVDAQSDGYEVAYL